MNFEDIVDMEWVDNSTANSLDTANDFSDLYFNQQLLQQQPTVIEEPQIKVESLSTMPSTEQIKQLIEIAKQQLVLREQLQTLVQQPNVSQSSLFQFLSNPNGTEIQTAAPSTIFAPPSITDNTPDQPAPKTTNKRRDSITSLPEESAISLEAYAEADGIDLKKLTPKERRQLRNKISARNFRVRRKGNIKCSFFFFICIKSFFVIEYISTLEGQVNDHKKIAEELKEKLIQAEDENKQLRKEVDTLKKQNQLLQQQSSPRIPKLNLNKDLSILGTKATDSYRQQDNFILVSSAVMPVWDYKAILEKPIITTDINKLAAQFILSVVQLATTMPQSSTSNHYHYHRNLTTASTTNSFNMEDLYDTLIQSALHNNPNADKSFLWQQ